MFKVVQTYEVLKTLKFINKFLGKKLMYKTRYS